jgi:hypothetical protein
MINQMSVYQHHDAVSGTARQDVANDYANRLSRAIKQNNEDLYSDLINQQVSHLTGGYAIGESKPSWEMCAKTNSTYLDCPITNYSDDEKSEY